MIQKDLLLQDLSSRLPYGVKCDINGKVEILDSICDDDGYYFNFIGENKEGYTLDKVKPYLFPLYSMTKKQKEEFALYWEAREKAPDYLFDFMYSSIKSNWLYKNHFDINGLIPLGLAKDATGLNIY